MQVLEPVRGHALGDLGAALFGVGLDGCRHVHSGVREALRRRHGRLAFELLDALPFQALRFSPVGRTERFAIAVTVHDCVEPVLFAPLPETHNCLA